MVVAALVIGGLFALRGFSDGGGHDRGAAGPTPESQLINRTWTLAAVKRVLDSTGSETMSVYPENDATLRVAAGRFIVQLACGTAEGELSVAARRLVFGVPSLHGSNSCVGSAASTNTTFIRAGQLLRFFAGSVTWSINADQLALTKHGETLTFTAPPIGTSPAAVPTPLLGTWYLSGYRRGSMGSRGDVLRGGGGSLTFSAGNYTVGQACDNFAGTARAGDHNVILSKPVVTVGHPCPYEGDQAAAADALLLDTLGGPLSWFVTGEELTLTRGSTSLTFTRSPDAGSTTAQADRSLVGTKWALDSVQRGSATVQLSVAKGGGPTLVLAADGTYGTSGGLTSSGSYRVAGKQLILVRGANLGKSIPLTRTDPVGAAEFDVLDGTADFSISGRSLTVSADGVVLFFLAH